MMRVTFDLLAPIYDVIMPEPEPERLRKVLRLPAPGRVLEAGAGTGRVSSHLLPFVETLVVNDLSAPMLQRAKAKGPLRPVQSYVERLPFPDSSFNRVFVVDAFHHFEDHEAAVGELVRVLAVGGRLVIEEPDIRRFAVKLVALAEKLGRMRSHFLPAEAIASKLARHGLEPHLACRRGFTICVVADK